MFLQNNYLNSQNQADYITVYSNQKPKDSCESFG